MGSPQSGHELGLLPEAHSKKTHSSDVVFFYMIHMRRKWSISTPTSKAMQKVLLGKK
jgi:hypothetical protein